MPTAEVVIGEPQRICSFQILPFLAERIGQSCHAPDPHADAEILALNMRRANPIPLRVSNDSDWDRLHNFARAFAVVRSLRSQILSLGGQVEVFLREAAGIMGDEGEADTVVADVDVRMVAGLFGKFADAIDELERSKKILELKCPDELAGFNLPAGQLGEAGLGDLRG
jgi:hypothetical protein